MPVSSPDGSIDEFVTNNVARYLDTGKRSAALPIIDVGALYTDDLAAIARVSEQIGAAATGSGFLYVENHGVSQSLIDEVYTNADRFFALDFHDKLRYYIGNSPNHRGFVPITEKGDYDDEQGERVYEAFDMSLDMPYEDYIKCGSHPLAGPNVWPDLEGFSDCLTRYFNAMHDLGNRLCLAFELALDLPRGFFVQHMRYPTSQLRLIHYLLYVC